MTTLSQTAATPTGEPWLLTPGPLTTSPTVKQAMLHDYGSRDTHFIALNARVRERLLTLVNGQDSHVCVPLQGSGTFVVEAMLGNFVPANGKVLILINGAYGKRIAKICDYYRRTYVVQETPEDVPVHIPTLEKTLAADTDITHVVVVYCETTSGLLNPLAEVAQVVAAHDRDLLIDAMSAFGALPLDAQTLPFAAVVASSNKCLEGAPGMGFCLAQRKALEASKGHSPSLSLDLYDQWDAMEKNGQWRFTPPTHVILAFDQALNEFEAEGGIVGGGARYQENCQVLIEGMRRMGFQTLLPDELQAPIIVTFHMPADPKFCFETFYERLRQAGYVIYPGKLTVADSFRIGCIGRLGVTEIRGALEAIRVTLAEMDVRNGAPKIPEGI